MNEFILFLKDYWKLIVAGVFFIASLVIAIIRKKPVNHILYDIYLFAVEAINSAEATGKKGLDKLHYAVAQVEQHLELNYPSIKAFTYYGYIVDIIERILTTPQKKGDDK